MTDKELIAEATQMYMGNDAIMIEDINPTVERTDDGGAWVKAWVWVPIDAD